LKGEKFFSDEAREVIGISHDIALDLGYNQVTAIHLFLADYIFNGEYSSQGLIFSDENEFQKFYDTHKIGEGTILAETKSGILPLAGETSFVIRKSLLEMKKYHHNIVQPFHLLLAISTFKNSFLSKLLNSKENTYLTLVAYYKKLGYISEDKKQQTFISKLKNHFRVFHLYK
jgi:ATP-dependent Clp protease ATP-binding subunit ClpA